MMAITTAAAEGATAMITTATSSDTVGAGRPGLERQLIRNGHLPGLEKKMLSVPSAVCRRLPPLPPETVRGYYGGHVAVYNPHAP